MPEINVILDDEFYGGVADSHINAFFLELRGGLAAALNKALDTIELRELMIGPRSQGCEPLIVETLMGPSLASRHDRIHDLLAPVTAKFVWDCTEALYPDTISSRYQLCSRFRVVGDHGQIYKAVKQHSFDDAQALPVGAPWIDDTLVAASKKGGFRPA